MVVNDEINSVFGWLRVDPDGRHPPLLALVNFTPAVLSGYRVGVPHPGRWSERLNTDSAYYGGGNAGNLGAVHTESRPMHGHAQSLRLTLPPLSTLYLQVDA